MVGELGRLADATGLGSAEAPEPHSGLGPTGAIPSAEYAGTDFARGAQVCREMMARFVEQGGDATTAASIRANWHPGWGDDPGSPPAVINTWEAPECPEGEAAYAEWVKSVENDEGHRPDTSPDALINTARMLEEWAIPMFPANRAGQIPFVRCMMECAVRDLRAVASAMSAGTAETPQEAQGEARQRGGEAETP